MNSLDKIFWSEWFLGVITVASFAVLENWAVVILAVTNLGICSITTHLLLFGNIY